MPVTDTPMYADVVGQERAIAQLEAAVSAPVHAYLFVGPPGAGKRAAALAFAASLLCPDRGCGTCQTCRRIAAGTHLDVTVVERAGPFITVEQAQDIVGRAARTPAEGSRKVLILVDFHLLDRAAPVLLKTVEEPPPGTVFLILAEYVPPELVTIASRCVRIDFDVLPAGRIADALVAEGVPAPVAAAAAEASGGRLDRARLLAADPEAELRRVAWASVPARLDGTGATAATVAAELLTLVATAGGDVLATRHATEAAALDERAALTGERGGGRREMEERHRREQRRLRTDELRFGLAVLEAAYRDRAAAGGPQARGAVDAARSVQKAAQDLVRNPNEALFVQALMVRLTMAHIGG